MKLNDLVGLTNIPTGTYVAVVPTAATKALVQQWAQKHGIPIVDDLHVTLLFSKTVQKVITNNDEHQALPKGFLTLGHDAESKCIVLELESRTLYSRHKQLISQGHTHDYDDILLHMTLMKEPGSFTPESMPKIDFGLTFGSEYSEPLKK